MLTEDVEKILVDGKDGFDKSKKNNKKLSSSLFPKKN